MNQSVAQNIAKVKQRIRLAAANCDRDPAAIALIVVSKTRSADEIRAAVEACDATVVLAE